MWRWAGAAVLFATVAQAEAAPPTYEDPIVGIDYGIFCDGVDGERVPAPDTELGYIEIAPEQVEISLVRQKLPAEIGLAFGVIPHVSRDVAVLIKVHRPGRPTPESWESTLWKDNPGPSYFTFDYPHEQVPGLWALEAWEGDHRLYRVEYLITPPGSDPALTGLCQLMS